MLTHLHSRTDGTLGTHGFDQALPGIQLVSAEEKGVAVLRLPVTERVHNINGTLHGGAVATLVDVAGTLAIVAADRDGRAGVTTDLNVSYFAPGTGAVLATGRVIKIGRTLAFISCDLHRESDGVLVAQGRMTKFMG